MSHAANASHDRLPLDRRANGLMLLFCLVLGIQQVAIKSIATDIAPLAQIALRTLVATVLVGLLVWRSDVSRHKLIALLAPGLLVGLGFAGEFGFVAFGLNYTTASHMVVFLYTAPIFAALGLHVLVPGEQLALRHWAGIVLAFAGVLGVMLPQMAGGPGLGALLFGDFLGLLAGMSWAATTVTIRHSRLSNESAVLVQFYQLAVTTILLVPIAWASGALSTIHPTMFVLANMTFQTLGIAFGAVLLWFWLLRRYLASRLGVFSFLTPVFGVAFGVLLMNDALTTNFLFGGGAIVAGILMVSYPARHERRQAQPADTRSSQA